MLSRLNIAWQVLGFAMLLAPAGALAQNSATAAAPVQLPPAAQESIDKGLSAAKQQKWEIAIRSFQEARKTAPDSPIVYYNLGLAESKIPGRELRAVAWFGAYLAAAADAPNAEAVNDFIVKLQIKNRGNLFRVIKSVQDAANQTGDSRELSLTSVPKLWAGAGDMAAALKTLDLIQGEFQKSSARIGIVDAQLLAGDIAGAQKTADLVIANHKTTAQLKIAEAQAEAGDNASALSTTDLIHDTNVKAMALVFIAKSQAETGDISGAKTTIALAQKTFAHLDSMYKDSIASDIADAQARAGDIASARKSADLIQDAGLKDSSRSRVDWISTLAPGQPAVSVVTASNWLDRLDDSNLGSDCPLNTDAFLDLARYLTDHQAFRSAMYAQLYTLAESERRFQDLKDAASVIVTAKTVIDRMLERQARQKVRPR